MAMPTPHLLLIILEDSGALLGCDGDPVARRLGLTPNIDALAERGTRWSNHFAAAPVCAPARSAMITGRHPIRVGTHHMRSQLLQPPSVYTQHLRDHGYFVSWPTKTDFNFEPDDCPGTPWRDDADDWLDRLADGALNDRPTFLTVNFVTTHESGMWPAAEIDGVPAAGGVKDGKPQRVVDPADVIVPPYLPDVPTVRADLARHCTNLAHADRQVGAVLEALEQSGRADQTVVMLTADHGRGSVREKRHCYPAGLRVPLILAGPDIDAGRVVDTPSMSVDIAATLLDLAGIDVPADMDGVSLLGKLPDDRLAFFGRDRMDEAYDCVRGCTDGRWFFLHNDYPDIARAQRVMFMERLPTTRHMREAFAAGTLPPPADAFFRPKPTRELYDLAADPHAVHNLADEPVHAKQVERFAAAVETWRTDCNDQGCQPESELVKRGLVADKITEYAQRLEPLPADQQPQGTQGIIERPTG